MTSLSSAALQAMYAQETGDLPLVLLTISHEDLEDDIRVTSDNVETVSNGDTFVSYPFEIRLPDGKEGGPPSAYVSIDNISVEIARNLRAIRSAAQFTIDVIMASAPNTVIASFPYFKMRLVRGDSQKVFGDLTLDDVIFEPFPGGVFSPALFPGLYG